MSSRFSTAIAVLAGLVLLALAWTHWRAEDAAPGREAEDAASAPARQEVPEPETPGRSRDAGSGPEVADARSTLLAARTRRDRADAAIDAVRSEMAALEEEIASLERYVESLEARGEDPADHAFEGMERFEPVLAKYHALTARFEDAEREALEAAAAVEEAERALAHSRRDADPRAP